MIGTLKEIKQLLKLEIKNTDIKILINNISTDSRNIKKGDLFLALNGKYFNGNDFIFDAIKKGAVAIIGNINIKTKIPYLKFKNTIKIYHKIAAYYRLKKKYKVIAITGSSGKTTTKDMIYCILSNKYKVEKTNNNNNNEIGVPLTILSSKNNTEILILELGMRKLGEIADLTKISKPDIGIVTNVGISHIGLLGSKNNILKAKKELFDIMVKGIAIINGEDGFQEKISKNFKGEKHIFGFSKNSSIRAIDLKIFKKYTTFTMIRKNKYYDIKLPFLNKYLILDALIAIDVACIFNISIKDSVKFLNKFKNPIGRMNLIKTKKILILNSSYNANPDSMKSALLSLSNYKERKIAILGDMLELGDFEKKYHIELGEFILKLNINFFILVGIAMKHTFEYLIMSGIKKDSIYYFSNINFVFNCLKNILKKNDVVLIKGSNSMNMKKIVFNLQGDESK